MESCVDEYFENEFMNVRIASVFVLLFLSALGCFFPIVAPRITVFTVSGKLLFVAKYFGSGVIIATAFIHLLGEAEEYFASPCLGVSWPNYPWASAFALMGAFTMFSIELFVQKAMERRSNISPVTASQNDDFEPGITEEGNQVYDISKEEELELRKGKVSKLVNLFLLEFGIVFHSAIVGLTMAVAGGEFPILFVAKSFHQFFEGLGIGARFASMDWPSNFRHVPWIFAAVFSVTTPLGVAAGLGLRAIYSRNSSLFLVGLFDLFCAGLLIYNSMVELLARDFLGELEFKKDKFGTMMVAYCFLAFGITSMAILGLWA